MFIRNYYVPLFTVLGTGKRAVNRADKAPCLLELTLERKGQWRPFRGAVPAWLSQFTSPSSRV